jgi:hypothetical protein
LNIPPNTDRPTPLTAERYRTLHDPEWHRENRKRHKQQQRAARRAMLLHQRISAATVTGELSAALAKQRFVPSAPSLRKKTPTEG